MIHSDKWTSLRPYLATDKKGNNDMGALLSIELGREHAEVVREVLAANPQITGITTPVEVKPGIYVVMTNTPVPGSAGLREVYHVNGKVRKIHETFDLIHAPRMEGSKLKYEVRDGPETRIETKRVLGALVWDYL